MTRRSNGPTVLVWIRVTPEEKQQLEEMAANDDRSLASMAARIVRQELERQRESVDVAA